jgi:phage shock protein E
MIKKRIYLNILMIMAIAALASVNLFSGCGTEDADTMEINPAGTAEEPAVEMNAEGEGDLEEARQDEEGDPGGTAPGEEASKPAQVMDISPAEVFEIMENSQDYLIVDVRTKSEYDTGHLEGAMLLPVQELEDRMDELPADRPIIVYCRSGARSRSAAEILVENGFAMVYDMGGISSWEAEGYPVVR